MNDNTFYKFTLALLIISIPFYIFFLIPHYKKCIASGTDRGTCIHTWLVRW